MISHSVYLGKYFEEAMSIMSQDKTLTCRDCGADFVFTAAEQDFFAEKGFTNEPGRCPECRAARKQQNRGGMGRGGYQQREMFDVVCAACGQPTQVPFRPSGDRPVYCRDCFQANKRY
jgi:CxxC-x17-CxxC domain-containing protein